MPKTLVLVPDLSIPGGVSNYYKTLQLNAYSNIDYFTINTSKPQSNIAAVWRLGIKYLQFFYQLISGGYRAVIVNPSLDYGKSFHRDMIFIMLAHLANKKSIVFFRGWFEPYEEKIKKSKWKTFLFNISYARVSKYIVLGNIFKKKLLGLGVPASTEFFVETTVADSRYLGELDLETRFSTYNEELNILFLSRIEKEKGVLIALDAFKLFTEKFPGRKARFTVAGDGIDLQMVKDHVQQNKIAQVTFLGHVNAEQKKPVLLRSHIMIFPSFTEGLPNVILEGMLYGMPVIARATGGIPEVVKQGENGFITESYDPLVFLQYIIKLATDFDLYKKMSKLNHATASERFTSEKVKERILSIIEGAEHKNSI